MLVFPPGRGSPVLGECSVGSFFARFDARFGTFSVREWRDGFWVTVLGWMFWGDGFGVAVYPTPPDGGPL